ncbi:hypothetical protein F5Y15DRAFT_426086 [Xylariaceae sp. FL0016]|nr:hypothetical protein F5Y15DRAFT_426086 [Xylariaceae sp. FL0016]
MAWASQRQTMRPEDIAYCLLGVFGVQLALIYGEGKKAFIRLQEEIIRTTNDLTVLAWSTNYLLRSRSILAPSPKEFKTSRDIVLGQGLIYNPDFLMTNKGLRANVFAIKRYGSPELSNAITLYSAYPDQLWDEQDSCFRALDTPFFIGILIYTVRWRGRSARFVVACGFAPGKEPWAILGNGLTLWDAAEQCDTFRIQALASQYSKRNIYPLSKLRMGTRCRRIEAADWMEVALDSDLVSWRVQHLGT